MGVSYHTFKTKWRIPSTSKPSFGIGIKEMNIEKHNRSYYYRVPKLHGNKNEYIRVFLTHKYK
jgi:hypothetical protein